MTDPTTNEPLATLARRGSAALVGLVINAGLAFGFTLIATHQLEASDAGALFEAIAIFTIASSIAILARTWDCSASCLSILTRPEDTRRLLVVALFPSLVISLIAGALLYGSPLL